MDRAAEPQPSPRHHRVRNTAIVVAVMVAIVVAIGITAAVVLQQPDEATEALTGSTVEAESLPQTVPFITTVDHLVVDVVYDEADAPVPMIFDTGAPFIVSDDVAARYAGEPVATIRTASIDETVAEGDLVTLPTLDIGGALFSDVAAVRGFVELDNPLSCISQNGLIGSNLMQTAVWQIDYQSGELTAASSLEGLDHVDGAISLDFERATAGSPSPLIELPAGEGRLRFVVDTGSDGWLSINPADLEGTDYVLAADAPAISSLGAGSSGLYETRLAWTAADLQLGDAMLEGVPIATIETLAEQQGNIGNAFLSNYVVTIDWNDDTLYLDPVTDELTPPIPPSARYGWDGDTFVVSALVEGDPGVAGLTLGDPVSAIDGVDVSGATRDEFCERFTGEAQTEFKMTVTGDEPAPVEVSLAEGFFEALAR